MKLFLVLLIVGGSMAVTNSKIEADLVSILKSGGTADAIVSFKDATSTVLDTFDSNYSDRQAHTANIVSALNIFAIKSQQQTINVLDNLGFKNYQMFWITNQLLLKGADLPLLELLLSLVANILKIAKERIIEIIRPINIGNVLCPSDGTDPTNGTTIQWGVNSVRAPEAWEVKRCSCICDGEDCGEKKCGCKGQGVKVGFIDTGVSSSHKDLTDNYLGGCCAWKDCTTPVPSEKPYDDNGHGTHVTGTAVGTNGIGVAPKANWISCKALNLAGIGLQSALLGCAQFLTCPNYTITTTKCPGADIISNSWGGGQVDPWYDDVIRAWLKCRIIPVFANGNSGSGCATVNSPADSAAGVLGVGASGDDGTVADFSSRGPSNTTANPQAKLLGKPDVSAPGVNVRSASRMGDNCFQNMSGTSMATPHVAGCLAILLSYLNPRTNNWTFEQIVKYLFCSANEQRGKFCPDSPGAKEYPNYYYGYGNVNCFAALQILINDELCDPPKW